MALTGKRKAFADAVLIGKTNKEAAIAAGYSINSAGPAGSRLAKYPEVVEYLAARRAALPDREQQQSEPAAPVAPASSDPDAPFNLALALQHDDPQAFLKAAMNDIALDPRQRIDAAKALMPYTHQRLGEGGKKDQKNAEAKKVASRFSPAAPPKLVAAGGKKV
jgi:phage terminase small subunit